MPTPEIHNPTTLYLLRHGEPDPRFHNCYYGQQDVPLSERGLEQSHAAAAGLADVAFDAIYSSDLERAIVLADLMAAPRGMTAGRLPAFRERHMGAFQGVPVEVLHREHGPVFGRWLNDRIHFRCPEAENFPDLCHRILPAVRDLVRAHPGQRIALACHAGPIRVTLADALGCPLENIFRLGVDHCSVHVIDYPADGPPRVQLMNGKFH